MRSARHGPLHGKVWSPRPWTDPPLRPYRLCGAVLRARSSNRRAFRGLGDRSGSGVAALVARRAVAMLVAGDPPGRRGRRLRAGQAAGWRSSLGVGYPCIGAQHRGAHAGRDQQRAPGGRTRDRGRRVGRLQIAGCAKLCLFSRSTGDPDARLGDVGGFGSGSGAGAEPGAACAGAACNGRRRFEAAPSRSGQDRRAGSRGQPPRRAAQGCQCATANPAVANGRTRSRASSPQASSCRSEEPGSDQRSPDGFPHRAAARAPGCSRGWTCAGDRSCVLGTRHRAFGDATGRAAGLIAGIRSGQHAACVLTACRSAIGSAIRHGAVTGRRRRRITRCRRGRHGP